MTWGTELPGPDWPDELTVDVTEIGVDGDNPNEMSDEQFSELIKGIRADGWLQPILLTPAPEGFTHEGEPREYVIADGEHRWKAAKGEFGFDRVPALIGDDWSEAQRRLIRQRMNKVHGEHDPKADALEFDWLIDQDKESREAVEDLLDARDENLQDYLDMIRVRDRRDNPPSAPPQPEVYNEDCIEGMATRLEDDSVDLILTDPPYGVNIDMSDHSYRRTTNRTHADLVEGDKDPDEALDLWASAMPQFDRVATNKAHLYCFASWKTADDFRRIIESYDWEVVNYIVWIKKDANQIAIFGTGDRPRYAYKHEFILFAVRESSRPLDGYPDDVFEYTEARWADVDDQQIEHPTQKPVALLEEFIERSSERGDVVLDPFAGSGATGEAACKLGREVRLWELEEEYIPTIEARVHQAKRQQVTPTNQVTLEDSDGEGDPDEEEAEAEAD